MVRIDCSTGVKLFVGEAGFSINSESSLFFIKVGYFALASCTTISITD